MNIRAMTVCALAVAVTLVTTGGASKCDRSGTPAPAPAPAPIADPAPSASGRDKHSALIRVVWVGSRTMTIHYVLGRQMSPPEGVPAPPLPVDPKTGLVPNGGLWQLGGPVEPNDEVHVLVVPPPEARDGLNRCAIEWNGGTVDQDTAPTRGPVECTFIVRG